MNNYTIKYIYDAVDRISPKVIKIKKHNISMAKAVIKNARAMDKLGNSLKKAGSKMKWFSAAAGGALFAFAKSSADLERVETAFVGILGSAEKAKNMVGELNKFTAKTPFQLEAVAGSAKKLLASKEFNPKEIPNALEMIGNMASAASTDLEGLASVYSKAAAKGKVQGEIFDMFNDRGIPVLNAMAEMYGKTKAQILEMGASGEITFKDLMTATEKMTSKGGFAFKAMILQSKTAYGVLSTVMDNVKFAFASLGDVVLDDLKAIGIKIIDVAQKFTNWAKAHPKIAKLIVIITGLLAILAPVLVVVGQLAMGFAMLSIAMLPISGTALIIAGVITALTVAFTWLYFNMDKVKNFFTNTRLGKLIKNAFDLSPLGLMIKAMQKVLDLSTKIKEKFTGSGLGKHAQKAWGNLKSDAGKAWEWAVGDIKPAMTNNGSMDGTITIQNNSGNPVESSIKGTGIAKGVGTNMVDALGGAY